MQSIQTNKKQKLDNSVTRLTDRVELAYSLEAIKDKLFNAISAPNLINFTKALDALDAIDLSPMNLRNCSGMLTLFFIAHCFTREVLLRPVWPEPIYEILDHDQGYVAIDLYYANVRCYKEMLNTLHSRGYVQASDYAVPYATANYHFMHCCTALSVLAANDEAYSFINNLIRNLQDAGKLAEIQINGHSSDSIPIIESAKHCRNIPYTLIENSAVNINAQDMDGDTILHHLCRRHLHSQLALLIKCGADIALRNNAGFTAIEIAADDDETTMVLNQCRINHRCRLLTFMNFSPNPGVKPIVAAKKPAEIILSFVM